MQEKDLDYFDVFNGYHTGLKGSNVSEAYLPKFLSDRATLSWLDEL